MHSWKQMKPWQPGGLLAISQAQRLAGPAHAGEIPSKSAHTFLTQQKKHQVQYFFAAGFIHTLPSTLTTPTRITFFKVPSKLHRTVGRSDIFYRI